MNEKTENMNERTFSVLVEQALPSILDAVSVEREPRLKGPLRPDFLTVNRDGRHAIVEVKVVTPATELRLDRAVNQLRTYGQSFVNSEGGPAPLLVLVVSGSLTPDRVAQLKRGSVDRAIDGPTLRAARPDLPWPDAVAGGPQTPRSDAETTTHPLVQKLDDILPGRPEWQAFQRIARDILATTLSPPLDQPLDELANLSGVNRRDIIFPNYATEGFWKFLRDHYEAHFIVVDAKNYVNPIKKQDVLQIANYLSLHGSGLFGMIVCRQSVHESAEVTRREQWVIHRKLVIVLNDVDLKQMLSLSVAGGDPAIVIRQKIEDFRLSF